MQEERLITIQIAACLMALSVATTWMYVRSGLLKGVNLQLDPNKRAKWRLPASEVERITKMKVVEKEPGKFVLMSQA